MLVANALYDVVFKYLMEDKRVAKLLLSALLRTEVLDLELKPQEYSFGEDIKQLTVYRIDFKARIKTKEGKEQVVLIELQKAKFATDIMRFRRYLGKQYANNDNAIEKDGKIKALPIITIYFLGYSLEGLEDIPVVYIGRSYFNHNTGQELPVKSEFVESLTHDSIIVQVEAIKRKDRKTELEKVLSVFEPGMKHEISIDEKDYPEKYKPIIRKLFQVMQDEKVRETMQIEDEILEELKMKERLVEKTQKEKENAVRMAEEAQKERENAVRLAEQERKKAEQERQKAEQERQKAEHERRKAEQERQKLITTIKNMLEDGFSIEKIAKYIGEDPENIKKLIQD